ncbi:MAG: DUF2062 domain-containing protein [Deltaproteobacteria bacterium]|nr:DUF2062 domain-containing protein [Deltaproteobacteria bacterium]
MKAHRLIRYYCLRFIRLRGNPHELALGMAFGIFTGMMPIMPFQMALSVALALIFKGSKITAALGTWVSNPLNWYFLYYFSYKLGASILSMEGHSAIFSTIMDMVRSGVGSRVIVEKTFQSGGLMAAAFLLGGVIMGTVVALPSYFVFLYIFKRIRRWRDGGRMKAEG